ncbi:MAG: hypothetical protein V7K25_10860 [Nostoc sp.]
MNSTNFQTFDVTNFSNPLWKRHFLVTLNYYKNAIALCQLRKS